MTSKTNRPRGAGGWLAPSDVHRLGTAIRSALDTEPTLTLVQLAARTGAAMNFVVRVRNRWKHDRELREATR
jgi:hypothetical protein